MPAVRIMLPCLLMEMWMQEIVCIKQGQVNALKIQLNCLRLIGGEVEGVGGGKQWSHSLLKVAPLSIYQNFAGQTVWSIWIGFGFYTQLNKATLFLFFSPMDSFFVITKLHLKTDPLFVITKLHLKRDPLFWTQGHKMCPPTACPPVSQSGLAVR